MQILYGAMPDKELMTIAQAEYIEEVNKKRLKMSQKAKIDYERSKIEKVSQTNHISQGFFDAKMPQMG